MFDEIKEDLAELNPFALLAVGLEDALIGYTLNHHDPIRAVYDYNKCLRVLMERDGMDAEGADEFLSFNTLGAFVGTDGPLYVRLPDLEEEVKRLTDEEREAVDIACMNLAETVRRGRQKQDEYMQEGDLEGGKWTEKGVVSLVQARDTLRSLLERLK